MKLPVRLLLPQPPEFLIFKFGHTVTVVLSYLQFKFPYPGTHSLGGFYSWASASVSSYSLYLRSDQIRSVAQSCLTLCDPMDCSLPGSSVHGILQARILEWVDIFFSRGTSQPRDISRVSHIAGRLFTIWATREVSSVETKDFQRGAKSRGTAAIFKGGCLW